MLICHNTSVEFIYSNTIFYFIFVKKNENENNLDLFLSSPTFFITISITFSVQWMEGEYVLAKKLLLVSGYISYRWIICN